MFDSSAFYLFNAEMSLTYIYIITYSTGLSWNVLYMPLYATEVKHIVMLGK